MLESLLAAAILITLTVTVHMVGLIALMSFLQARSRLIRPFQSRLRQGVFTLNIVLGLVVIHGVEILIYALAYHVLGVFPTLEAALYYSTSAFTTVGFGDVAIESGWRLLGALEGLNGFLLIGWSTAFLVAVIGRMRSMEMDWLDRMRDGAD